LFGDRETLSLSNPPLFWRLGVLAALLSPIDDRAR
jgi:hypothetical protein